jgi:geranylgeranyl diphosphate synthase type II
MMRHSLEGQAIEVGWIRNNACDLVDDYYYRMCMKKSSWYTCIHPCRVGALVAEGKHRATARFDRYGCYLGAAFLPLYRRPAGADGALPGQDPCRPHRGRGAVGT